MTTGLQTGCAGVLAGFHGRRRGAVATVRRTREAATSLLCGAALLLSAGLAFTACAPGDPARTTTIIVHARVIDGSGDQSRDVNVRIEGDRIAAVGDFEPAAGDTVVNADGLVLAPGFIDVHSHHDSRLFELPEALAAVNQGITTIVAGQDGGHQYPLAEFFAQLEASPAAVNVASYAGFGTFREEVMGEDYQRHATPDEVAEMKALLRTELEAGALGLSSGLEYDPGSFSTTEEVIELARLAAAHGGTYISHIRSEDRYFWEAIEEIIRIGREADLPVQVTHMKLAMNNWWGQAERLLTRLDEARASGVEITADIYPYRAWATSFTWLTTVFPDRDLDRRDGAEYILRDLLSPNDVLLPDFLPEPAYNGLTLAEIAEVRGSDVETTLMDLLKADTEMGSESLMIGFAMDEPDIEAIMAWPHAVICSDGGLDGSHPRGFGAFTRFLGRYVRERNVVSLEEGIRKMTSLAAEHLGITDRGSIAKGHYADLVLFDPETVIDRSTYEDPHLPSAGIEKVWVNGEVVFDGGETTGNRPGRVIRR
ncbi:MAG: D-aminoacylase [Holophagales bacterium]|nr:D-aminoacylase [Holophagales bacterium]MYH27182.1 D-aminoacylase [Holophagales bacterium]